MSSAPCLGDVCDELWDPDTRVFGVSEVLEQNEAREVLVEALAAAVIRNKADVGVLSDLLAVAGWEPALAAVGPGRIAVWHGDLGEVIAAESIEAFDAQVVPVRKLRYQIDPNQTLPGSDVVGFEVDDDGEIIDVCIHESKFRLNPGRGILVEAHDQLAESAKSRFATTMAFLAHRLSELDPTMYQAFLEFLGSRGPEELSHAVCLSCESAAWSEGSLDELADHPELLDPIFVRIVALEDIRSIAEVVADLIELEIVDDH